jgi:4-alpha-glucanotransferase
MIERSAGVLVPLFSLRTAGGFGRGDIGALRSLVDFAAASGHRVIQLLPVDETAPGEASPYSAISVFAVDPLYISLRGPGGVGPAEIRRASRKLAYGGAAVRAQRRATKLALLRRSFEWFDRRASRSERAAMDKFCRANREWLQDYALFRALKEQFAWNSWESWPDGLRRRDPAALSAARREFAAPIGMYAYWQFLADRQWREVRRYAHSRGVLLGGDLAFSPSRESAEVWANQRDFDLTRTVGAPPDAFNEEGQRWGLPMPLWSRMRERGYSLWRARARRAGALYDLVRVDHVVGLYRTFWFDADGGGAGKFFPAGKTAQRRQGEEIMRALIEVAAPAQIIAEDLGIVPPWVRRSLTRLGVPGYKVLRWERDYERRGRPFISPSSYPELSVATTGTHDTDTLKVWWSSLGVGERRKLIDALRLAGVVAVNRPLELRGIDAILGALYAAPSRLAVVPIQDLFGWTARINVPGTVSPRNWTWRLPFNFDGYRRNARLAARARKLRALAGGSGRDSR